MDRQPSDFTKFYIAMKQRKERVHTNEAGDTRVYWQMIIMERFKCETDELKGYWCRTPSPRSFITGKISIKEALYLRTEMRASSQNKQSIGAKTSS